MSKQRLTITSIQEHLAGHQPEVLLADRGHAAVAMVLHDAPLGPEALFIIRAAHDDDPWSGDIGFPGGRLDAGDKGAQEAAERETREELGLNLQNAEFLGRLDDLYGATLPILVSCFVYLVADKPEFKLNHEVSDIFWLPLAELLNPQRHHEATFNYRGKTIRHPAVDLLGPDRTVLWGITYRLIRSFYSLFDITFGSGKVAIDARP